MKGQPNHDEVLNQLEINDRLQRGGMSEEEAFHFSGCCAEYYRALFLIRQYDEEENTPDVSPETQQIYRLEEPKVNLVIKELKSHLASRGENVDNFAVARNGGIGQVVGNIYQTWNKKELYPHVEDKAVHLFYFLVKDHLFIDGNKRIASFLFLWFLDMNDILVTGREDRTITYTTIYALAIFVAESSPKDKDLIVRLIRNLVMTYRKALPDEPYATV